MNSVTMEDFGLHRGDGTLNVSSVGKANVVHKRHHSRYLGPAQPHLHGLGNLGVLSGPVTDDEIARLFRAARRYQFGAEQDMNPIVAFLHNSYSVAYIDAIEDLATDIRTIDRAITADLGKYKDWRDFKNQVHAFQDKLQKQAEGIYEKLKGHSALKALLPVM